MLYQFVRICQEARLLRRARSWRDDARSVQPTRRGMRGTRARIPAPRDPTSRSRMQPRRCVCRNASSAASGSAAVANGVVGQKELAQRRAVERRLRPRRARRRSRPAPDRRRSRTPLVDRRRRPARSPRCSPRASTPRASPRRGRFGTPPGCSGAGRPEKRVTARSKLPQKKCTGLHLPRKPRAELRQHPVRPARARARSAARSRRRRRRAACPALNGTASGDLVRDAR